MRGASVGVVVAGGNGQGNANNQLNHVAKVVVHKNGTMFICDRGNSRIQRWFKDDDHGETIIANISCLGLAFDNEGSLYVADNEMYRVIKFPGEQIVAGGNGQGSEMNQFFDLDHIFIDQDKSVFAADFQNCRVMKWSVGATEGIIVAGGNGGGDGMDQFGGSSSMVVDHMGTIYVVDTENHRIMRWFKDSKSGSIILGGQDWGDGKDQLQLPYDIAWDRQGNLYVADNDNHRIQMFAIDKSSCVKGIRPNKVINLTVDKYVYSHHRIDVERILFG